MRKLLHLQVIFLFCLLLSCAGDGKSSLSVKLELTGSADPSILSFDDTIVITIYGPDFPGKSFSYSRSSGSGTIDGIPDGHDRVIKADEYSTTGALVARGFVYGVTTGGDVPPIKLTMVPKGWVVTLAGGNSAGGESPDGTYARDVLLNGPTEVEFYQSKMIINDLSNLKFRSLSRFFKIETVGNIKDIVVVNKNDDLRSTSFPYPIKSYLSDKLYYFSADFQIFSTDLKVVEDVYYNSEAGIIFLNQQDKMFTGENNQFYFSDFDENIIYSVSNGVKEVFVERGTNPVIFGEGIDKNNYGLINPTGVFFESGKLYFSDAGNNKIKFVENGQVYTFVGSIVQNSFYDGILVSDYNVNQPDFINKYNNIFYIYEKGTGKILFIKQNKVFELLSNSFPSASILQPLPPDAAGLQNPRDLAVDDEGNIYIADTGNNAIRMVVGGAL